MKLLILLLIIPNVYCGITNNFTVLPNNDIYIAHTKNSVIYKKTNDTTVVPIVGKEGFHSKNDEFAKPTQGSEFILYRPTSIINNLRNDIYFVNNDKYIKYFNTYKFTVQSINIDNDFNNVIANITTNASNNLYVASNDNFTIITENNIQTKRISSWINAVYSLPKCEINNLNISKFDNDLRISVKISPSKIIK